MQLLSVLLTLLPIFATAKDVMMRVETTFDMSSKLGIHWMQEDEGTDMLIAVVKPGETTFRDTHFGHSFALRSAEFDLNLKMMVEKSKDRKRPYTISFKNAQAGKDAGVELQLAEKQFQWLESGKDIARDTDIVHRVGFLRGGKHLLWISLHEVVEDEL